MKLFTDKNKKRISGVISIDRCIWLLFAVEAMLLLLALTDTLTGSAIWNVITYAPLVLLLLHIYRTSFKLRGLLLVLLAATLGTLSEYISLHYGTLFGGTYTYPAQATLFGVPLGVVVYWAIFIYSGYWLVTTFGMWLKWSKPSRINGSKYFTVVCLAMLDGLAVMAVDLFMDPVQVKAGSWTWTNGGAYFGVPVGNFVGWFVVAFLATLLYRTLEYLFPSNLKNTKSSIYLLPVIVYLVIGVDFLMGSIKYQLYGLIPIGVCAIVVPAFINIWLYAQFRKVLPATVDNNLPAAKDPNTRQ